MLSFLRASSLLAAVVLLAGSATGSDTPTTSGLAQKPQSEVSAPGQKVNLLDFAFKVASALPHQPHIKTRSKLQYEVVAAWLAAGDSVKAEEGIRKIDDWQQGLAWADLAYWFQKRGDGKRAKAALDRALFLMSKAEDWRRDRIRVRISNVYTAMGDRDKATFMLQGLDDSEKGKAMSVVGPNDDATFAAQMQEVGVFLAEENQDIRKNALDSLADLHSRHFDVSAHRQEIEAAIDQNIGKLPVYHQLLVLGALVKTSSAKGDDAHALELIGRMQALVDSHRWPLEDKIKISSLVVAARAGTSERSAAKSQADGLLEEFRAGSESIKDMWRGEALRPLAEAYVALGATAEALNVYRLAVEEGARNPNARPRAVDLHATCLSMAKVGLEPDAALQARMDGVFGGLVAPW